MNFQMAMEFLLINVGNPYLDQPLTFIELQNIAKFFQTQEELSNIKNPLVDEAIKNNCCTFVVTGPKFVNQTWYFCKTCGLDGNKGCCQGCANTCHKGHELSEARISSFFCDCGAGEGKNKCQSLNYSILMDKKNNGNNNENNDNGNNNNSNNNGNNNNGNNTNNQYFSLQDYLNN